LSFLCIPNNALIGFRVFPSSDKGADPNGRRSHADEYAKRTSLFCSTLFLGVMIRIAADASKNFGRIFFIFPLQRGQPLT
jgi:hypothetical protein